MSIFIYAFTVTIVRVSLGIEVGGEGCISVCTSLFPFCLTIENIISRVSELDIDRKRIGCELTLFYVNQRWPVQNSPFRIKID